MGNYHDDLRVAAQDVVDARKNMGRLAFEVPSKDEIDKLMSNLFSSIDRLKSVLDMYDA